MNKLLRTVRINNNRDEAIKKLIIDQLSNSIRELQYSSVGENSDNITNSTEAANQLCIIIESIFLHGLRDSLTHRFKKALADVDERPEPSFWSPLLVISHRQIVDQILTSAQITTEVGQCRAWIRQALNDCLLSSYLSTIRQNPGSIKNFYNIGAFLRDNELTEIAQKLIEGFESVKTVMLPCNSSLLNSWHPSSLYLAGIWAPTLKNCPVAPCDDVAQSIEVYPSQRIDDSSDNVSLSSAVSLASQTSHFRDMMAYSEDEVLKMILNKTPDNLGNKKETQKQRLTENQQAKPERETLQYTVGNSLERAATWSCDDESSTNDLPKEGVDVDAEVVQQPKSMECSFNALIDSYNVLNGDFIRTPNLKEVWQKIDDSHVAVLNESEVENQELVLKQTVEIDASKRTKELSLQMLEICREKGLDQQNYECLGCNVEFVAEQKFNVCGFTGDYFCDNCMSDEMIPIPARIIHNWDFLTYPVSQKSFNYINEVKDRPLLDLKTLNPFIYGVVEEMASLQSLRNQLNYLRAYLYTCREPIIGELQKLMFPKEYMYEHVHRYSVNDLMEITNGALAQQLKKAIDFGKEHVTTCWLCNQKGFICEICEKPKTIFPFDVENVYRCNACNAVFHKKCFTKSKPCPKCKRKKKREDISLLGATVEIIS